MTEPTDRLALKRRLYPALADLAGMGADGMNERLSAIYAPNGSWRGSAPLDEASGIEGIAETVWRPLFRAFPDLERRDSIFVAGPSRHDPERTGADRPMRVAAMGHLCGTFREPWLGIAPTGGAVFIRYGEVHEIGREGLIERTTMLLDVMDVIRQAGFWPIAPSPGAEEMWPAPITADGIVLRETDPAEGEESIEATLAMHRALADFDDAEAQKEGRLREALLAMPQRDHWHAKMMWYGPAGVGTCRGLEGFVDVHQRPFRVSFPNRKGGATLNEMKDEGGGGHYIQIGDGPYSVTGGFPSVRAMHLGGEWLGAAPTGRAIQMRVMDFYLHHEGLIRENWVPLDTIDLLRQMGVDVMDRTRRHFRADRAA